MRCRPTPACASSTHRRTAAKGAPCASVSPKRAAPSSRFRMPTSNSTRRSWRPSSRRSSTGSARVVYGSRFLEPTSAAPLVTVIANRTLTAVTNVLYGSRITDMETCYKIMDTGVARSLDLESDRFDIEPEITAKLLRRGHTIVERPVRFEPRSRAQGKKIGWRDGVRALQVLVKYRWS